VDALGISFRTTQLTSTAKTNTLALVSFTAAFVIPIAGLVLGVLARQQLSSPGNLETGRGLARWAMLIGALGTLFQVAFSALNGAPIGG
jgi:hypothetical protein